MVSKNIDQLAAASTLSDTDKVVVAQGDAVLKRGTLAQMRALLAPPMPEATIKGRAAGAGTGAPQDLTPAQARTAIGLQDVENIGSTSTLNTGNVGKNIKTVNAFGSPTIYSSGSVFFLATGAYTDTMNYYFQREANYTGGGAGDTTAGVNSPVRGEVYIRPGVTYAVEAGGLFISNNYSYLCQSVGSTSQSNVYEGGRGWGSVHEAKTWQKVFSAANGNLIAGQTVFPVPNGYTPNKSTVAKNGALLTRTTDFVDSSGTNLVLVTPVLVTDVIEFWRGDDLLATMGVEIDNFAGYGTDDLNPTTGNRLGAAIFLYRRDKRFNVNTHVGSGIAIITDPTDAFLTTDRGLKFVGKYRDTIDFTDSTSTRYFIRLPDGGGLTKDGNLVLGGAFGTFDIAGFSTLCVGETTNGGIIRIGDGTHVGRFIAATASGVQIGSETAIDFLLIRNGTERARLGPTALQIRLDASADPVANGYLVAQATSNTSLTFKYRGSDGTIRSASLTLT